MNSPLFTPTQCSWESSQMSKFGATQYSDTFKLRSSKDFFPYPTPKHMPKFRMEKNLYPALAAAWPHRNAAL